MAHFAHFEGCQWDEPPGQVLIARRSAGWSWCIPLADRLSIGIVLGQEDAARLGCTPGNGWSAPSPTDRVLAAIADGGKRVTEVATYANYQLISEQGHGRAWAMLGDAFGFVDPMLSPGRVPRPPLRRAARRRPGARPGSAGASRCRPLWTLPLAASAGRPRTRCCRLGSSSWRISTTGGWPR